MYVIGNMYVECEREKKKNHAEKAFGKYSKNKGRCLRTSEKTNDSGREWEE